mmetsp:Transcript_27041/g.45385  ORF Transcript_27041/g.45385 Transcript_27041/m.45385 type:complete len:190 (-) Transcript_27041:203-772(-)
MYVFDPDTLQLIVKEALDRKLPLEKTINCVVEKLGKKYGSHVNKQPRTQDWLFNNAGGAMGAMFILHASITEYLIIFGTPIGTEGHTGRFMADDYFIILHGEQWAFKPGQLERMVFKPGDMHHLPRGDAEAYRMPEQCFALEYARGCIPAMLPFGIADTFSSTLDFHTLAKLFWIYAKNILKELSLGKI